MPFILRVGMQPLLFLFVFTFIMPRMSGGNPMMSGMQAGAGGAAGFGTVLLPGLMAVAIMFSGIANVALPLSTGIWDYARNRRPRDVSGAGMGGCGRKDVFFSVAEHGRSAAGDSDGDFHPRHAGLSAHP